MTQDTVRRFRRIEIAYHWCQAIPYLVLFVTGGGILLQRLLDIEVVSHRALSLVHRGAGIALIALLGQVIIVGIITGGIRELGRTAREGLRWRGSDLVWLIKAPLTVLSPRVVLPASGRFNPGQKMHMLFLFLLAPGSIASGVAMMFVTGALAPWIVHVALFAPACLFVCLHLFLSLINPPTRESLPSIFTGEVSAEYARAHHALWQGGPDDAPHAALVSRGALALTAAVAAAVLGCAGWAYGPARLAQRTANVWEDRGADAIIPGGLCASHAGDPEARRCQACHLPFSPPPTSACLSCHPRIEEVLAQGRGYHGNLGGECRTCHADHAGKRGDIRRLDADAFNHNRARYALEGRHRELPCEACHGIGDPTGAGDRTRYVGLRFDACTDCHKNPHPTIPDADCAHCHTEKGWRGRDVLFVHNRDSSFRLSGGHTAVECAGCHAPETDGRPGAGKLRGLPAQCAGCHNDPHGGQFEESCETCHSDNGWKGPWLADFHGKDTSHALTGKHAGVDCAKCHALPAEEAKLAEARFEGLPETCEGCHSDPHKGQMQSPCATCHTDFGWEGAQSAFSHELHADYAPDSIHAALSCAACHGSGDSVVYRPLPKTCEGCHIDVAEAIYGAAPAASAAPDPHADRVACVKCHLPEKRSQGPSEYAAACGSCHNQHYEGLYYDWMRSFGERQARAERVLEDLRDRDAPDADEVGAAILRAKAATFHNILLARKLWDRLPPPYPDTEVGQE